jgi:hypothetical protein
MDSSQALSRPRSPDTYWLTRFMLLRWMGFVYVVAFYVAARQLVPLVGEHGLTPAPLYMQEVREALGSREIREDDQKGTQPGTPPQVKPASAWTAFWEEPSLFWFDDSDTMLRVIPWLGFALSCALLAGYTNAIVMTVLWIFYLSIVQVGQTWYGYGWEIQMSETGFLCIFLCPLLDPRPFPARAPPIAIIWLFRWLIFRIMLGSALIKLRGDSCWHDLTALYYHFETQPIPNPFSRYFHFLPHPILQFGVIWTFVVELVSPFFIFWPRWGRYIAGGIIISFQLTLIVSGNLSFFNWLTILPALACFDDRFWRWILPTWLKSSAMEAQLAAKPSVAMTITVWCAFALIAVLSIYPHRVQVGLLESGAPEYGYTSPVLNLIDPPGGQAMNTNFDSFHLVNTYGAFGSVGRERPVIVFEGTDGDDPSATTGWKEYPYVGSPWDPKLRPPFIAPYQPHLDWQLWFAAMGTPEEYSWTYNLVWKLLHNDPATLSLFAGNPFPEHPPKYVRAVLYIYHFAPLGNSEHVYWTRDRQYLWLGPYSTESSALLDVLRQEGWLRDSKAETGQ